MSEVKTNATVINSLLRKRKVTMVSYDVRNVSFVDLNESEYDMLIIILDRKQFELNA